MNAIGSQIRHIARDRQRLYLKFGSVGYEAAFLFSDLPRMVICLVGKAGIRLCDCILFALAIAGFASPD